MLRSYFSLEFGTVSIEVRPNRFEELKCETSYGIVVGKAHIMTEKIGGDYSRMQ